VCFYNSKEGPLQVFGAVPLYRPHYGKWRYMPPISYTCVESTDGVDYKRRAATCQADPIGDSPGIRGPRAPSAASASKGIHTKNLLRNPLLEAQHLTWTTL